LPCGSACVLLISRAFFPLPALLDVDADVFPAFDR
jgi:hypothetical protein